jgi:hypothetical protein
MTENETVASGASSSIRPKPPKYTAKVRRGLALIRGLLIDSFDDRKPSTAVIVSGWKKAKQSDLNAALAWVEGVEVKWLLTEVYTKN